MGSLDDVFELNSLVQSYGLQDKVMINQTFINEDVKELFDDIEKDCMKPKAPKVLMIFDDQITNNISQKSSLNMIDQIFIRGRHCNISCIISTQKYKSLNNNVRQLNISHLTVFNGTNKTDIEAIAEEHSNSLSKEEMINLMSDQLQNKYSFMTVSYQNDINNRFLDNKFNIININK